MKQLFKGQISCKAVFSKQARDSYYHGILAATELGVPSVATNAKDYLRKHERTHTGDKPFNCSQCDYMFNIKQFEEP